MNYTMAGSIYLVTNTVTKGQYVGQTTKPAHKRWAAHLRTAFCPNAKNYKLHNAIVQYGVHAFEFKVLWTAFDLQALDSAEVAIIADRQPMYNSTKGGSGRRPFEVSLSERDRRSSTLKALWADPVWRAAHTKKLKIAGKSPAAVDRGRQLAALGGGQKRWQGHIKKPKPAPVDRAAVTRASWEVPDIREKRIKGLKLAAGTPEARARATALAVGRKHTPDTIANIARTKWKPVYCPELACSFLSMAAAADYLGVLRTSVSNAIKQKGRVLRQYSLELVT